MTDNFTEAELLLATFKSTLDNGAMLRLALSNQVKIMQALKIDIDLPEEVFSDLSPEGNSNNMSELTVLIKSVGPISMLMQKRAWEWVKMNTTENPTED